jgi:hypothetical protein
MAITDLEKKIINNIEHRKNGRHDFRKEVEIQL